MLSFAAGIALTSSTEACKELPYTRDGRIDRVGGGDRHTSMRLSGRTRATGWGGPWTGVEASPYPACLPFRSRMVIVSEARVTGVGMWPAGMPGQRDATEHHGPVRCRLQGSEDRPTRGIPVIRHRPHLVGRLAWPLVVIGGSAEIARSACGAEGIAGGVGADQDDDNGGVGVCTGPPRRYEARHGSLSRVIGP